MNKVLNNVIFTVIGAAVGAGGAWFFTRKYYAKKKAEEVAACKSFYEKKTKNDEPKTEATLNRKDCSISNSKNVDKSDLEKYKTIISQHYDVSKAVNNLKYDEIEEKEPDVDDEDYDAEYAAARAFYEEKKAAYKTSDKPYIISADAFNGDDTINYREEYEHVSLDYFEGDDKLTLSDSEKLVECPENVIGIDYKLHFGDSKLGCDEDCVYIRNDRLQTDYEIIRDKGSYSQLVLGIELPGED